LLRAGQRVAIKKITDVFSHVSVRPRGGAARSGARGARQPPSHWAPSRRLCLTQDATRILREVMLLRQLKHPDIVEIKHILLPPQPRAFKDVYIVFELMETDLHQVIKANDDLTAEHHQFFLYQMLRGLKYVHSGACALGLRVCVLAVSRVVCLQRMCSTAT
jgi:serine/threonine protein kinase